MINLFCLVSFVPFVFRFIYFFLVVGRKEQKVFFTLANEASPVASAGRVLCLLYLPWKVTNMYATDPRNYNGRPA